MFSIDRQPPDPDGGNDGVTRQFSGRVRRQIVDGDAGACKRVETGDIALPPDRHEATGDPPSRILGHLFAEIAIQRVVAAGKSGTVMSADKILDTQRSLIFDKAAIALCRTGKRRRGRRRVEERMDKAVLILNGQTDDLRFLDGFSGGLACDVHDKIRQCPALNLGSPL